MAETFGKTGKGGESAIADGTKIWGCKYQSGSAGTLEFMSVYIYKLSGTKVKCAIYNSDRTKMTNGETEELDIGGGQDGWMTPYFLTPPSVLAATDYWLCVWVNNTVFYYRDAGSSNQLLWTSTSYDSWPDTLVPLGYGDYEYSIFATYEEAPPAAKTLVQAALISIPPLIVLPTLGQILKVTGGC